MFSQDFMFTSIRALGSRILSQIWQTGEISSCVFWSADPAMQKCFSFIFIWLNVFELSRSAFREADCLPNQECLLENHFQTSEEVNENLRVCHQIKAGLADMSSTLWVDWTLVFKTTKLLLCPTKMLHYLCRESTVPLDTSERDKAGWVIPADEGALVAEGGGGGGGGGCWGKGGWVGGANSRVSLQTQQQQQ